MSRLGGYVACLGMFSVLSSCRPQAESPEAELARQQADHQVAERGIAAAVERFVLHYNSGHADSVAAFFAEDAHLMPADMPTVVGRTAIQAAFVQALALKPELKLVTESVSTSGNQAIERGTYEETHTPAGSKTPIIDRGKYLVHWRRIGGLWLIVDDIANSDLPGTSPPSARRP